jgi:hypothetical protein
VRSQQTPGSVISYFYFDFNDSENSNSESLIRSLIAQLSGQMTNTSPVLEKMFAQYQDGAFQPRMADLLAILSRMLQDFQNVYFVIDALDECIDLEEALEILAAIQSWSINHLHIVVTSRLLPEIGETLSVLSTEVISVGELLIDRDIRLYISHRLTTDRSLAKWPLEIRRLIQNTLSQGAGGM